MRWVGFVVVVLALLTGCGSDGDGAETFDLDDTEAGDAPEGETTPNESAPDEPAESEPEAPVGVDRAAELIGTWNVTFYALPNGGGRTNVVDGEAPIQMTFGEDGTISYHTGCNAGGTTYTTDGVYVVPESALDDTPEGQAISIEVGEAEEQGCEGFLGEQNDDLPAAWQRAERFRLDGDILILSAEFFLVEAERG